MLVTPALQPHHGFSAAALSAQTSPLSPLAYLVDANIVQTDAKTSSLGRTDEESNVLLTRAATILATMALIISGLIWRQR